jgi:predicted nucleic-acid-binding protein
MIGLDTNILVRFLTQDDPVQSSRARQIIERQLTEENRGFVSLAAMFETAWVLEKIYKLSDREVAETIKGILQIETLFIQNEQEVYTAMVILQTGRGAFADALINALGLWAGCDSTLTFDRKASRLLGFELIA